MKKQILAASVAASIGMLGSGIATAMDFSVYGSIRGGIYQDDTDDALEETNQGYVDADGDGMQDMAETTVFLTAIDGTQTPLYEVTPGRDALETGVNNFGSRIGIKGSEDLGNGSSVGFRFERGTDGAAALNRRHENVWIKGGWGNLTLGQTDNVYRNAANWDQSYWLGGKARRGDGDTRVNAITYNSNLSGPFSFSLQAVADDTAVPAVAAVSPSITTTVADGAATSQVYTVTAGAVTEEESIDVFAATASIDVGPATINVGYRTNNQDTNELGTNYDHSVISANGIYGGFSWYVNYEEADDNTGSSAVVSTPGDACTTVSGINGPAVCGVTRTNVRNALQSANTAQDRETVGVYLAYGLSERDTIYLEYEDATVTGIDAAGGGLDLDATLIGYSHSIGASTSFIAEYVQVNNESGLEADSSQFWAGLKVDF